MTRKNINGKNSPFLLGPAAKSYIWGGTRLNDDFSKNIQLDPLAETWECSTHPDGTSVVRSGVHKGRLLSEVLEENPQYLGDKMRSGPLLPILIKLIDAKQNLSIQVHPDDEYAKRHENGSMGKTEMWYVLDAEPGSQLIYGFHSNMNKKLVRSSIYQGSIEKYLQKVPIRKDDVFYIEAGTVHAICAGALIAEIQENSNLTYRLFDYNRTDKQGRKRDLHVDKALDVINYSASQAPRQPLRVLKYTPGCATELLCRCQYFQVERQLINTERCREMASLQTSGDTFQVLLCTDGCGVALYDPCESICFFRGDCIFVPARSKAIKIHGQAQLLKVSC